MFFGLLAELLDEPPPRLESLTFLISEAVSLIDPDDAGRAYWIRPIQQPGCCFRTIRHSNRPSKWVAHRSAADRFSDAYSARLYTPATPARAPDTWFRSASTT